MRYNRAMSRNGKVIVAMSGGVDSSVAACLLKEQGYDCIGVFMRVGARQEEAEVCDLEATKPRSHGATQGSSNANPPRRLKHGCCSATDALDARTIAGRLDIPFYALNFEKDFDHIIDYFMDEYGIARTPNPCVMCNIHLKFGKLLRYADAMDAEFVATGHYARILASAECGERNGELDSPAQETRARELAHSAFRTPRSAFARLARGVNTAKDQSYVLFGIRREDLGRCLFPIGHIADKAEVRGIAAGLGLRVHDKPDSQEVCFVPDNDYRKLIEKRRPDLLSTGEFVDRSGRVVGRHEGVAAYTIGQRHGLGLALGKPVYVTRLDVLTNSVTIGPKDELLEGGLVAERMNWLSDPPPAGEKRRATVKIRHMHTPAPGEFWTDADGRLHVQFDDPQSAVTPGQAAVLYDGQIVLGGGWIAAAKSRL
jgi:tRNA-specific 2-thiouridylase